MRVFIFVLICGIAFADEWSFKDFTNKKVVKIPNGTTVVGSCFAQEVIKKPISWEQVHIFPEDMTGVTFEKCNLDNVFIPPGNIIDGRCTTKKITSCLDIEDVKDWLLDNSKNAIEPVTKQKYLDESKNINPANIQQ